MIATHVTPPESFAIYLQAWNSRDPEAVRPLLDRSVSPDVVFIDPVATTEGVDALTAHITESRARAPEAVYARTSGIDGQKGRYRYTWEARLDATTVVPGLDVTQVDAQGRITRIDGFFGALPPLDAS